MSQLTLVTADRNLSSWSFRPWLLMQQAGIPFEEVRVRLGDPAGFGRYSPSGRVPVLKDGDFQVWDSLAIFEYLNEKFPTSALWPRDVKARAVARAICCEMHAGFQSLRQNLPFNGKARGLTPKGMDEATQRDIRRIFALWRETRERYGQAGRFLFGIFSAADAMYAPVVSRFHTYGIEAPDAVTQEYMDAIWSLPALQQWLSEAAHE